MGPRPGGPFWRLASVLGPGLGRHRRSLRRKLSPTRRQPPFSVCAHSGHGRPDARRQCRPSGLSGLTLRLNVSCGRRSVTGFRECSCEPFQRMRRNWGSGDLLRVRSRGPRGQRAGMSGVFAQPSSGNRAKIVRRLSVLRSGSESMRNLARRLHRRRNPSANQAGCQGRRARRPATSPGSDDPPAGRGPVAGRPVMAFGPEDGPPGVPS
jgi:hypothetical protein